MSLQDIDHAFRFLSPEVVHCHITVLNQIKDNVSIEVDSGKDDTLYSRFEEILKCLIGLHIGYFFGLAELDAGVESVET